MKFKNNHDADVLSLNKIYEKYASYTATKGDSNGPEDLPGGGDKGTIHSYIEHYDTLLTPYRNGSTVLEIGMWKGDSLRMWDEYFNNSVVIGAEIYEERTGGLYLDPNYNVIVHDVTKLSFLEIIKDISLDVVIDDGSHYLHEQIQTFHLLKNKMNEGGIYIIEDIKDIDYSRRYFEDCLHHNCEILDLRDVACILKKDAIATSNKFARDNVLVIYRF